MSSSSSSKYSHEIEEIMKYSPRSRSLTTNSKIHEQRSPQHPMEHETYDVKSRISLQSIPRGDDYEGYNHHHTTDYEQRPRPTYSTPLPHYDYTHIVGVRDDDDLFGNSLNLFSNFVLR